MKTAAGQGSTQCDSRARGREGEGERGRGRLAERSTMHKREREVERRGGGAPPRSLRDSKACGLGEASAPSLAPLCPLDRAQLEHVCDEVVPRLLLPHLVRVEERLGAHLELLELLVLLLCELLHAAPLQELVELVLAEPLHHVERRALVPDRCVVCSGRDEDAQALRVGVARRHVHRREARVVPRVDVGPKVDEQHASGGEADAAHEVEAGPPVGVAEVRVRSGEERVQQLRAVGVLRRLEERLLLGRALRYRRGGGGPGRGELSCWSSRAEQRFRFCVAPTGL
mmetsp:Transcript_19797/g.64785  ORF Transcript_19797/g.64785 Transcript_19797/m.64785 type:complete len:285 (-) Transcript_19797:184-1038(-)